MHVKLLCGVYILSLTVSAFNLVKVDSTYQLYNITEEDLPHLILICPLLATIRDPVISDISQEHVRWEMGWGGG